MVKNIENLIGAFKEAATRWASEERVLKNRARTRQILRQRDRLGYLWPHPPHRSLPLLRPALHELRRCGAKLQGAG